MKLQDFIIKQVSGRKRLKAFTKRIRGLVAGLTSVRAIDRMKWLANHGGADLAHVETLRGRQWSTPASPASRSSRPRSELVGLVRDGKLYGCLIEFSTIAQGRGLKPGQAGGRSISPS